MPTRRTFDKAEFLPNDNSTPHIVPDVLYPAIGGKLLDGTTSHSGDYGTSQTDSRKYYYTDIKGSRPIRDPRIGAHFGSQRHKFKSLQLLEQETASNGTDVYSIDGREWCKIWSTSGDWTVFNQSRGVGLNHGNTSGNQFLEFVGYFNQINFISQTGTYTFNSVAVHIDGVSKGTDLGNNKTSVNAPLSARYVDAGSVQNIPFTTISLGLHTCKITFEDEAGDDDVNLYGIELIAQDTTNAVTRNKIQIPSQTVFSFGSKFTVGGSSAATHYDPFSAKSDGTGWTSPTSGTNNANSSAEWPSNIDTATSLGLAKWVDGTNYYRPYNGGRVVKWVDENGEIKTSVTVMPPNAKSFADSGTLSNAAAKSNGSAPNDNFRPTFEAHTSSLDEDLLSEVTKTFYFREFGNGAANGGTGATYADASMLTTSADDVAYVMDDGLTSFNGDDQRGSGDVVYADSRTWYMTFIGTGLRLRHNDLNGRSANFILDGITIHSGTYSSDPDYNKVQNLPYGTHILKYDGQSNYHAFYEASYYQPKMPPIPEEACIIADYMLMADFVPQTSAGGGVISKGVRYINASRDVFYNSTGSLTGTSHGLAGASQWGIVGSECNSSGITATLPCFASRAVVNAQSTNSVGYSVDFGGSTGVNTTHRDAVYSPDDSLTLDNSIALAQTDLVLNMTSSLNGQRVMGFQIVTPIHTSHHYKSFETPFLHELIGGDRNMEQTHLICSADGKTWDGVTRDTSYIGKCVLSANNDDDVDSGTTTIIMTEWRSTPSGEDNPNFNKDFAIAYDRVICLVDGQYEIYVQTLSNTSNTADIRKNGTTIAKSNDAAVDGGLSTTVKISLKRGDYIQVVGDWYQNEIYNNYTITRL